MIEHQRRSDVPYFDLLYAMKRMRMVEETIAENYPAEEMRCPVHLSSGQEAVSAAVGLCLDKSDFAVSGHRAHNHYLAKGGSLQKMLAEIYGKADGCSSGHGGSMHLIDESVGFKGSTAIVGGTIPVGVGLGLSISLKKTKQISTVFLGDGATEEGVFYESANFAALKKLPVLFVCENNFYSVYSPLRVRQPATRAIHKMVSGIGIKTEFGDGNDAIDVYDTCKKAVASIRDGQGPMFLEFQTYRWREHCGPNFDNHIGYRTEQEYLEWREKDPIDRLIKWMKREDMITDEQIVRMDGEIAEEVQNAFSYAKAAQFPEAAKAYDQVYYEERESWATN